MTAAGPERRVGAAALGIVIHDDHVLLQRLAAWLGAGRPYRAIGGMVEFGERAADAVVREYREELRLRVEVVRLLDVREHLHAFPAIRVHEVTFTYLLRFATGDAPADLRPLPLHEQDAAPGARDELAEWVPLAELLQGVHETYPADLPEVTRRATVRP